MSMLTGDPRTATVLARGDTTGLRNQRRAVSAARRPSHPQAMEQVGVAAAARRVELDKVRAAGRGSGSGRRTRHLHESDASVSQTFVVEPRIANREFIDIAPR